MSAVDIPLAGEAETPHTAPARLVVEHASFAYAPARRDAPHFALEPVRFQARRGEMVMIVGPNASGKTTLLRLLSGVLRPLGGRVELDGAEVARLDPRTRAQRIAMVQQESLLVFPLRAVEYALQGRYPYSRRLQFPTEGARALAVPAAGEVGRGRGVGSGGEGVVELGRVLLVDTREGQVREAFGRGGVERGRTAGRGGRHGAGDDELGGDGRGPGAVGRAGLGHGCLLRVPA